VHVFHCLAQSLRDPTCFGVLQLDLVENIRKEFPSLAVLCDDVVILTVSEGLDEAQDVRMVDFLQGLEFVSDPSLVAG